MFTMKQLKTMPRGVAPVSSTGVHRNTKMYMQDSSSAWQLPSSSTCTRNNNTGHYWSGVEPHLTVAEDDPQSLHAAAPEVTLPVSIVLLPGSEITNKYFFTVHQSQ